MKRLITYQCEMCGAEYSTEEEALECEKEHEAMAPFRIHSVRKMPSGHNPYRPPAIVVELKNGDLFEYWPQCRKNNAYVKEVHE